jgi:hypothetical protein
MVAVTASGQEEFSQEELGRLLRSKVESVEELAANEAVVRAVRRHNERKLTPEQIAEIDEEWTNGADSIPIKKSLEENEVGRYFKSMIDFNEAIYSEAFLAGANGANVAAYPATTDYWQGDEAKWIEAYAGGRGEVYIGSIEFDESSRTNAIQISVPVMDEGRAIGVLIVGVKLTYLQARYLDKR